MILASQHLFDGQLRLGIVHLFPVQRYLASDPYLEAKVQQVPVCEGFATVATLAAVDEQAGSQDRASMVRPALWLVGNDGLPFTKFSASDLPRTYVASGHGADQASAGPVKEHLVVARGNRSQPRLA